MPERVLEGRLCDERDRHGLGAGSRVYAVPQIGQVDVLFQQQGHDVDQAAVGGLRLEAAPGICFQGVAGPAPERMLAIPAVVIGPCFIRVDQQVIAAQPVGVGSLALPAHDEHQVAVQVTEFRETVARYPQVDIPGLGVELRDVTVGVQKRLVPHVRVLVTCGAVEVHHGEAERR